MTQNSEYESIKSKLRKLLELSEHGVGGEADNARHFLDALCIKHDITIDELLDTNKVSLYNFAVGGREIDMRLFIQCYAYVTGSTTISYYQSNRKRASIRVELTAMQYAELKSLYEWHKVNLKRDLDAMIDTLLLSYFSKHNLYSGNQEYTEDLTPEEEERIRKAASMRQHLNNNTYHKAIE